MRKLHNPTDKAISFPHGRNKVTIEAGETVVVDDAIARHCLLHINNDIVEPEEVEPQRERKSYSDMGWNELRKLASDRGVYKVGMNKEEVMEAVKEEVE